MKVNSGFISFSLRKVSMFKITYENLVNFVNVSGLICHGSDKKKHIIL